VGSTRDCDDENVCTNDSCDEAGDECDNVNNTISCDDGLFCTENDACSGGQCSGTARDCDDEDVCTDDACNEGTDTCDTLNNTAPCDDGVFCNGADSCAGGECQAHAGDPCDGPGDADSDCSETCDETANDCTGQDADESVCSDANNCTLGDECVAGVCVPGEQEDPECTTTTSTTSTTTTLETTTTTLFDGTTTTTVDCPNCGDVNNDCEITSSDALAVLRAAVGITECSLEVCDYSGDGNITALDALAVLRASVDLPTTPNCPE
jgi:hypothetical protein